MHTIKPLDTEMVLASRPGNRRDRHHRRGQRRSAAWARPSAEYLTAVCPVPVVRHGVEDEFGRSGAAQKVLEAYHLTPAGIADKVRQALTRKQALTL